MSRLKPQPPQQLRASDFRIASIFILISLIACGGGVEIGYSPPIIIPVRVSVDPINGGINLEVSPRELVTPIGRFDLTVEGAYEFKDTLKSVANEQKQQLFVRVDKEMWVYELTEGEKFEIEFQNENAGYRKVRLVHKDDGDIILELESLNTPAIWPTILNATPSSPTPTRFVQQISADINGGEICNCRCSASGANVYDFGSQVNFCFYANFRANVEAILYDPKGDIHHLGNQQVNNSKQCTENLPLPHDPKLKGVWRLNVVAFDDANRKVSDTHEFCLDECRGCR